MGVTVNAWIKGKPPRVHTGGQSGKTTHATHSALDEVVGATHSALEDEVGLTARARAIEVVVGTGSSQASDELDGEGEGSAAAEDAVGIDSAG